MMSIAHFILRGEWLPLEAESFRWGWLGLSSFLGLVVGDSALFQAFVLIGPRLSALIMSLVPIFTTFLGWLIFSETVSGVELIGIGLTVAGVAWVVTERRSGGLQVVEKQYGLGIALGLVGALGQASGLISAKFGLVGDFPPVSANVIRMLVAMLLLWSLAALRGRIRTTFKHWTPTRAFSGILAGSVVGPFLGVWLSLIAIQLARVGIASTLMALTPIILIPLSYVIYHEGVTLRSSIGTVTALVGVALIFL
jgi:drug/metabolite transporter (DMT)-like permease